MFASFFLAFFQRMIVSEILLGDVDVRSQKIGVALEAVMVPICSVTACVFGRGIGCAHSVIWRLLTPSVVVQALLGDLTVGLRRGCSPDGLLRAARRLAWARAAHLNTSWALAFRVGWAPPL